MYEGLVGRMKAACVVQEMMEEERQERQALKMSGDLPLNAPDLLPEKKLFKCKLVSICVTTPVYML